MTPPRLLLCVPMLLLLAPAPALAGDIAAAEALFQKGVAEMEAGHFDVACPTLDESERLDPQAGTVFTEAECYSRWGRVSTAVALYGDYLRLFDGMPDTQKKRHQDRMVFAKAQIASLEPQRPSLTLLMPKDAPAGMTVKRDGVELAAPSIGIALPLDPGEHVISVDAPGREPNRQTVVLEKGDKKTIELIVGGMPVMPVPPTPAPPLPIGAVDTKTTLLQTAVATDAAPETTGAGQRAALYTAGGLGVAGFIVGGVSGGLAMSKKSIIGEHCQGTQCDHEGKVAADETKKLGNVSTMGFGVGIVGIATATILWLSGPSSKKPEPAKAKTIVLNVCADRAVIGVKGAF